MNDGGFTGRAFGYIERFPSARILVIGDIMLDEYVWGSVGRISPEAPVPVVAVTRETRALGGAANVAVNVSSLRAGVVLAGLVGADTPGRTILKMLGKYRIGVSGVVVDRNRPTTTKTRVIAHHQQVVRVDREMKELPDRRAMDVLGKRACAIIRSVDGVILSDYRKGVLSRELVENVIGTAKRHGAFVVVDPKRSDFSFYRGCTLITPNKSETEAALGGRELSGDGEIWNAGKSLLGKCAAKAILVTRGEEGMSLVERGKNTCFHIPAVARQVFDVTGAGDTVIGTLGVGMGVGATLRDAALIANVAAGVVVGEIGTAPITIEKLVRALRLREREREIAKEERNDSPPRRDR